MHPAKVLPRHYIQYKHTAAGQFGKTSINRDLEVLPDLLTMAVEWGVIDKNPLIGQVKKHRTRPRDPLVKDWEIAEVLGLGIPRDKRTARTVNLAKLYVRLKLMTGLRRRDILRLRVPELRDDGIHVQPHKTKDSTGIRLIIEWDPAGELQELVEEILRLPPRRVGDVPLFVTREGMPYIKESGSANAFDRVRLAVGRQRKGPLTPQNAGAPSPGWGSGQRARKTREKGNRTYRQSTAKDYTVGATSDEDLPDWASGWRDRAHVAE